MSTVNPPTEAVVVRHYRDEQQYMADATQLANVGYRVINQAWTRSLTGAARQAAMLGVLAVVLAAVAGYPILYLGALLAFGAALIGRVRVLTVTYQRG